jgi:hypothetical protein
LLNFSGETAYDKDSQQVQSLIDFTHTLL